MNYYLVAAALRAFSVNGPSKALYRWLGNRKVDRKLSMERAGWVLDRIREAPVGEPPAFLELGTGWMHAYSMLPALIWDAEVACFDVWDNRAFGALKMKIPVLKQAVADLDLTAGQKALAGRKLAKMEQAADFDQVYAALNMRYDIDENGRLPYEDNRFDVIFSVDVLEHVVSSGFDQNAADWFRVLKPGGRMVAQVGLDDHLAHYDPSRSKKHYLRHSDAMFGKLLENDVQYINRMPASEMIARLEAAGFRTLEAERWTIDDPENLPVHPDYAQQLPQDIATWRLLLTMEKP
ncbi:MAG: methyltransferase domain-containing protein [Minwuia sp.]|uniref:methyltransferase domain-containing protein n=1 Tax=Minwuia sp. TaxID=2493630 RepID=UPI003A875280